MAKEDLREYGRSIFHYVGRLGDFKRNMFHTAYFLDQHDVTRFFDPNLRWSFLPGDVYFTPSFPTLVKSRLLEEDNHHSVILKLDKLRHFMFIDDIFPTQLILHLQTNKQRSIHQNKNQQRSP